MKTNIGGGTFHLINYVLFFFIILVLSCTSTSYMRLEGNDFIENLPGRWEGEWRYQAYSGDVSITISKIDGNKVHLTGFCPGHAWSGPLTEVYGRIENSTLLLTWPEQPSKQKYIMKRDDSNNLILDGYYKITEVRGPVQLKKIE